MLLPPFEFHEPTTVADACRLMAQLGPKARLIAGGTDLIVNMKRNIVSPEHVVSLARIDDLKSCEPENGCWRIGACVTVAELAESDAIRQALGALCQGAKSLGTPLIRNLATIGGNLGSARPAADLPPSLMAYGAEAVLLRTSGERRVSLDQFFLGPGLTEIHPEEVLSEIRVTAPQPGSGAGYLNIGIRKAQDCNLVNVAAFLALEDDSRTVRTARIVLGCVGPTHIRALSAEKVLIGDTANTAIFAQAAKAAMADSQPIDDFRGSADYKRAMVGVLTRRTLATALKKAKESC